MRYNYALRIGFVGHQPEVRLQQIVVGVDHIVGIVDRKRHKRLSVDAPAKRCGIEQNPTLNVLTHHFVEQSHSAIDVIMSRKIVLVHRRRKALPYRWQLRIIAHKNNLSAIGITKQIFQKVTAAERKQIVLGKAILYHRSLVDEIDCLFTVFVLAQNEFQLNDIVFADVIHPSLAAVAQHIDGTMDSRRLQTGFFRQNHRRTTRWRHYVAYALRRLLAIVYAASDVDKRLENRRLSRSGSAFQDENRTIVVEELPKSLNRILLRPCVFNISHNVSQPNQNGFLYLSSALSSIMLK